MGYYVVVSDRDHLAPGFQFADSRLIADVYGATETAAAAERFSRKIRKIDGVICVAADAPVTAATVIGRLGLPGISLATAQLASDKLAMKRRFAECGVPVPWFSEIATPRHSQRSRSSEAAILSSARRQPGSRGVQ
jgi:biotin carboxylase